MLLVQTDWWNNWSRCFNNQRGNLPEDLESFIESRENIDNFSEGILQSEVLTAFDNNEVSRAYYFTETNELIPVYVADCESYERVRIFRADTGEEIQF